MPPDATRRSVLAGAGAATAALATGATAHASAPSQPGRTSAPRGRWTVTAERGEDGSYGMTVRETDGTAFAVSARPLQVLAKVGDSPVASTGGYRTVRTHAGTVQATGTLTSAAGSVYRFDDVWQVEQARDGAALVRVERTVTVEKAASLKEMGFTSRLAVGLARGPDELSGYHVLYPSMWYGDETGLPEGAVGADPELTAFYVRETRLALPFVLLREREGERALSLCRTGDRPRTRQDGFAQEPSGTWWINEGIQFGSLGVQRTPAPQLAALYPAFEGEVSYGGSNGWMRRGHPVREGFSHRYELLLRCAREETWAETGKAAWRAHWEHFAPSPRRPAGDAVHQAGVELLARNVKSYNGNPGLPFTVQLPDGRPDAVSYVMGFIGQQAPAGYQLLRAGLSSDDKALAAKGRSVLDFWAEKSPLPNGLPRLWTDGDKLAWREWYPTYVRVAADGMDGMLDAARLMRRRGEPATSWERCARRFGDFLVTHQGQDGSFPRAYAWDGSVQSPETTNTSHPVRFLCGLSLLTKDDRYLEAARRAGRFHRDRTRGAFRFIGGTADNPNVIDKEAGGMAFNAMLALYDATGEEDWLAGAREAADFTETWLAARGWRVNTPRAAYRDEGPLGLSFIAAGHSGMDSWITYQAANFYRLHVYTGDAHYRDVARFLTTTSVRTTQYAGNAVGYAQNGLAEEAVTLCHLTYQGVGTWLPWITVGQLEPLSVLEDVFGAKDIDTIEQRLTLDERRKRNEQAARRL